MICERPEIVKGGITAEAQTLVSLHEVVAKPFLEMLGEYYKMVVFEREGHKRTLKLLSQIVEGEVDPANLIVTQDGWQVKPERPQEQGDSVPLGQLLEEVNPNGTYTDKDALLSTSS